MSDLRTRILECALDLYLEQGLTGLSMRHVGDRLGVSATAIYRHYRNKEDLLNNVIGEAVKIFGIYLFQALSGESPQERYRLSGEAYLEFALRKSKYYEMIFMTSGKSQAADLPEDSRRQSMATFQFLADRVQECMECGHFRKDDVPAVALCIWSHTHGLVSLYLRGQLALDEDAFRAFYWESHARLLNGLTGSRNPSVP